MGFQDYSAALAKQPASTPPPTDVHKPAEAPAGFKRYSQALEKPPETESAPARIGKETLGEAAALADVVLGLPAQMVSIGADIGARGYAAGAGEDRRTGAQAGNAAAEWVMEHNPLNVQKMMKAFGYGETYDASAVNNVMQKVDALTKTGGEYVEKVTKGAFLKEDVQSLVNTLIGAVGTRLSAAAAGKPKPGGPARLDPLNTRSALDGSRERPPAQEEPTASLLRPQGKPPSTNLREQPPAFADETQLASWLSAEGTKQATKPRIKGPPATMSEAEPFQIGTPAQPISPTAEALITGRRIPERGLYDANVPPLPGTPNVEQLRAEAAARERPVNQVATPEELANLKARLEKINAARGEKGSVDPAVLARLAAVSGGAVLGSQLSDDKLLGAVAGAATLGAIPMGEGVRSRFKQSGAIKEPGGFWHPATIHRLKDPLDGVPENDRMVKNYLNKYAGTERDPLKDIEIPASQMGREAVTWGEAWDKAVDAKSANTFKYRVPKEIMGKKYFEDRQTFPDIPQDSVVWHYGSAHREALGAQRALHYYLMHVRDFLRNVPPEKLKNYDLVRAVKETAEADKRAAQGRAEAAAADTKVLPVFKEYPDGYKWVEITKVKEDLKEGKDYKAIGPGERQRYGIHDSGEYTRYIALDKEGKPIINRFNNTVAYGDTPTEAKLAGRLANEGNAVQHCVGGYCKRVASGEDRILSLRDEKGESHVTVELQPYRKSLLQEGKRLERDAPDITQIRGKQNRAPGEKYVPYVQDLIKSGKWGAVYELDNARLIHGNRIELEDVSLGKRLSAEDIGLSSDKYYTEQEVADVLKKASKDRPISANYKRSSQRGAVDVRTVTSLAAASLGVAAGAYLDPENPLTGAVLGAGVGLGVVNGRALVNAIKNMKADTRIRVDHLADKWEGMIKEGALNAYRVQQYMTEIAPKGNWAKITEFIEGNRTLQLTSEEAQAARLMLNVLAATQRAGVSAGVMSNALENYLRRVWLNNKALQDYMNAPQSGSTLYQGMRKTNKAPTIAEGKAAGLKPISEDARHLLGVYVNSVVRSIAAKQMVDSLKAFRAPVTNEAVVRPAKGAPMGWARINNPHLMGSVVHPDIAPSIRFVLDNADPNMIMKGLEGINLVVKRLNVSFSLFHAKALLDAYIGAGGAAGVKVGTTATIGAAAGATIGAIQDQPVSGAVLGATVGFLGPHATKLGKIAMGTDKFLQALKKVDPNIEKYIQLSRKNGLEFSLEGVASDDVRTTKAGFKTVQNWMDAVIPGMGVVGKGIEHINALSDRFMWERLHAGMKLNIFTKEFDRLQKSNAAAHSKNPNIALMAEDEIAKIASSYTNDLFGGLNWRRVAESMHSRFGRDLALEALKPSNRRILQLLVFAPDWTLSTFRAAAGAFPGGLKGTPLSRMHRMYLLRSAIYYTAIADAVNYPLTGHHIWQNNDPTRIDLGNGQTMQWSKHFTEPFHWGTMPIQQGLNKLGVIPKTAANFALGTEYLSSQGHSPKAIGGRLSRLARQPLPISVGQQFEAGPEAGIAGFFGVPIYGKPTQQREQEKVNRQLERQIHQSPQQIQKRLGRGAAVHGDKPITYSDTPQVLIPPRIGEKPVSNWREEMQLKIDRGLREAPKSNMGPGELKKREEMLKKRKVWM